MTQPSAFPHYRARVLRALAGQPEAPLIHHIATRLTERLADLNHPTTTLLNASLLPGQLATLIPSATLLKPEETTAHGLLSNLWLTVQEEPAIWLHSHLKKLEPDAPLLATALGSQTMNELFNVWQHAGLGHRLSSTPLPDVQAAGSLLQRLKLALPVVDRDVVTLTFPTLHKLLETLHDHAALLPFQTKAQGLLTPRQLTTLETTWRTLYPRTDNRLPLSLEILYLHGFTPGANQPKAAQRGSGKNISFVRIQSPEE